MLLYIVIAVAGYLSFLDKTPELVIQRPPLDGTKDILMIIGRLAMTFNLITCLPLNIHPVRRELFTKIFRMTREPSFLEWFIVTLAILCVIILISILFPNIIQIFGVLGGTCSVGLVIFFPGKYTISEMYYIFQGLTYVMLAESWTWKAIAMLISTMVLSSLGLVATILSLL